MLALEVHVDGEPYVVAGAEDWSLLTFSVSVLRGEPGTKAPHDHWFVHVTGLAESKPGEPYLHMRWIPPVIQKGSAVTLKIVDAEAPDPPAKRYRSDGDVREDPFTEEEARQMRWESYLDLKAEFEPGAG